MKRKLSFGLMMLATLFAASCAKELVEAPVQSEEAMVTFSVNTPEIATRAYSDGTTATVLQYAVYDAAGVELTALTKTDATINGSATVELQLTTGNTYSVIFWAAAPNAPYTVNFAEKTMTVDYNAALSNDEARDAFYKYHTFTVTGGTFTVKIDPIFDGSYNNNWNDGSNNENENPDQPDQPEVVYSEWKLLGSHNAWASEEFMVLEDGLAVARNVEFPATKAEGDGEFKVSNGTDWYGMPVAATVGADKYFVASKDNSQNVLVAPGKYDIWFDQAKATVYVMTPGKAIAEATEFKVETPEQPETESWGIVGTFNEWLADLAMTEVKIGEVDYWFADNFVVAEGDKFKFRYIDGNWDDANVFGAAVNVTVDAACELLHPGNDIAPTAGTYDIYLDAKNALVYVMTNGKTPADVVAPEKTNVEIYVVKAAECVNLYTWGAISTGTWPGKAADEVVTINAVDYYKWTLSVATTALGQEFWLIFNNGNGVQTADSDKYQLAQKMYFKVTDGAVVKIDEPH